MVVSDGTANGVTYLNGSKVLTSGSNFTYSNGLTVNGITQAYNTSLYTVDGTLSNFSAANNVYLNGNTAGGLNLRGDGTGGASAQVFLGGATSSEASKILFTVANSEGMRLTSTGLGIGTSSPSYKLDVVAASSSAIPARLKGNASGNNNTQLRFAGNNSGTDLWAVGTEVSTSSTGTAFDFYDLTAGANRMRLDSSGNLGLGVTPSAFGSDTVFAVYNASTPRIKLQNSSTGTANTDGAEINMSSLDLIIENREAGNVRFFNNGAERTRITSDGSFIVGATAEPNGTTGGSAFINTSVGRKLLVVACTTTSNANLAEFANPNGVVGSIATNGSATAYNTSSDYRLKNTIAPMTGALARVALLKPVTYKWNADNSNGEGFIAHELAEIVPNAVTGEKDAVNADGNPQYQGIDVSFLVATLTAALQELDAKFEAYKASHP